MIKGTTLARVIQYAKGAEIEEVQYAIHRMSEILKERLAAAGHPAKAKRPRRSKAQIAADKVANGGVGEANSQRASA